MTSNIAKLKLASAISGIALFLFLIAHATGNLKYFQGAEKLDSYALFLRQVGKEVLGEYGALWLFRMGLLTALIVHVTSTVKLWSLSRAKRPAYEGSYDFRSATVSSRYMLFLGIVTLGFVIFHILHLTVGAIHPPGFEYLKVHNNVTLSFQNLIYVLVYAVGVGAVAYHLSHGIWSSFASLGVQDQLVRRVRKISGLVAAFLWLAFMVVPFFVYFKSF